MDQITNCFELIKRLAANHRRDDSNFTHLPYLRIFNRIDPIVEFDIDNIKRIYLSYPTDTAIEIPSPVDKDLLPDRLELERDDPEVELFMRLFSVPLYEKPSLQNLLLIAETIGILSVTIEETDFTEFYVKNRMDRLDTYLRTIRFNPTDLTLIKLYTDQLEDDDMSLELELLREEENKGGELNGGYFTKYLKYKAKYLQLKN